MGTKESDYYEPIKAKLELVLKETHSTFHLEITANKTFSNTLKAEIADYRHMVFYFLKDVSPDITGFIREDSFTKFIIVEIKNEVMKLDHIYQVRKYAELFEARYALLVSTKEVPEEIKRLRKVVPSLLSLPAYETMTLVKFNAQTKEFDEWFPKNPFERST